MDLLTQGLLGAALAQAAAGPREQRRAAAVGFCSGLLADADALIRSSADPLLTVEYHRHFTHAVAFIPLGALVAAAILWPFLRGSLTFGRLYLFALLGYSLSGFLDACTSYGAHLWWPFSGQRTAFHVISIIDPVFTLALLLGVVLALRGRVAGAARAALALAGAYLLVGAVQLQRAESAVLEWATRRGHTAERLLVKPTLGNLLVWRSVYQSGGMLYVDAVRAGVAGTRIYEGGTVELFVPERDLPGVAADTLLRRDIARFTDFSDGYVALHPRRSGVLGDMRFSNSPAGLDPVWGIDLDMGDPERHARYNFYRDLSTENRRRFLGMLLDRG